jgi:hypothetical protein
MTVTDIISMLEKRIAQIGQLRTSAERLGDIERVTALDAELAETEATLAALRALE